jgi:hypothetical protein
VGAILIAFIPTLFLPNHAPGVAEPSGAATQDDVAEAMLD